MPGSGGSGFRYTPHLFSQLDRRGGRAESEVTAKTCGEHLPVSPTEAVIRALIS